MSHQYEQGRQHESKVVIPNSFLMLFLMVDLPKKNSITQEINNLFIFITSKTRKRNQL